MWRSTLEVFQVPSGCLHAAAETSCRPSISVTVREVAAVARCALVRLGGRHRILLSVICIAPRCG